MRLLHLNAGNLFGGIETYLVTLAKLASKATSLDHTFLLTSQGRLSSELQNLGADVRFCAPTRLSRPWTVRHARRELVRVVLDVRPDAIVAHGAWPLVVFEPSHVAPQTPVLFYLHVHDSGGWLDRLARRVSVDVVVANSSFTAGTARRAWPNTPITVCRYPVLQPERFDRQSIRAELGLRPDEVAILQVSRFEEWKGQLLHVEALRRIPPKLPWRAFLVGGASRASEKKLRSRVLALASWLPEGRFELLGERNDVPRLMQAADIFCQPNSGPEPFGLVFVEALWAGLPVVTTEMGGAVEIVDRGCGRLCSPDPAALASTLEGLITDQGLRNALGKTGPVRARDLCGPEQALEELRSVVARALLAGQRHEGAAVWA